MINRFFIYSALLLASITSLSASDEHNFPIHTTFGEPSDGNNLNEAALRAFTLIDCGPRIMLTPPPPLDDLVLSPPPSPRDYLSHLRLDLLDLKPFYPSTSVCEKCNKKCFSYRVQKSTRLKDQELRALLFSEQPDTEPTSSDNSHQENPSPDIGPRTPFHALVLDPNSLSKGEAASLFEKLAWITLPNSKKSDLGRDIKDESNFCGFDLLPMDVISYMSQFLDNDSFKQFSSTSKRIQKACDAAIPGRLLQIVDTIHGNYGCHGGNYSSGLDYFMHPQEDLGELLDFSSFPLIPDFSVDLSLTNIFKFPTYLDLETGNRPLFELTLMRSGNLNLNAPSYLDLALDKNAPTVTETEHSVVDKLDLSLTDEGQIYSSDKSIELNKESLSALDLATD